ncbi:hypothetical protein [Adhaeribacter terreus]|uniref:Uncharacterized protein n=1 Tax=Adhaeribacter terreus TaxID=529703 RepID=A0ABW0E9L1_9BACT
MLKTNLIVFAIWLAGAACNCAFAQQRKSEIPDKVKPLTFEILVDQYNFPVKMNTGNPERDQQVYAAAKQNWVAANKELYRRYNSQGIKVSPEKRRKAQPVLSPSK